VLLIYRWGSERLSPRRSGWGAAVRRGNWWSSMPSWRCCRCTPLTVRSCWPSTTQPGWIGRRPAR